MGKAFDFTAIFKIDIVKLIDYNGNIMMKRDRILKELENDPYQDISDEVEAKVDSVAITDLFAYCIEICEKTFSVAEVDFGKKPLNLPANFFNDIGFELECRRTRLVTSNGNLSEDQSEEKYGADKEHYEGKKISLNNLKELLDDSSQKECNLPKPSRKIRHICTTFLPAFFGLKYSKEDSDELKFEKLRLVLILYAFKANMKFELGYLMKKATLKSNALPPAHKKGVIYIKEMVAERMPFVTVMELERWVSSEYNAIRVLSTELINFILQQFDLVDCVSRRLAMQKLYYLLCERLTLISNDKPLVKATIPEEVEAHAYIYFSEQMILGDLSVTSIKQMKWMNIEPVVYESIDAIVAKSKQSDIVIEFDRIKDFVSQNTHEISDLIAGKYKDRVRILSETSIRDYMMMIRIYQLGFHIENQNRDSIKSGILLLLILLYEGCKRHRVDFSIVDRIARKKTIHSVLSKISHNEQDEQFLTENWQYAKIIAWLIHKMFMLETYRTPYIVVLERRMQKKLRRFWKNNISIIDRGTLNCKYQSLEDIYKVLIHENDIQNIVYEIKNK